MKQRIEELKATITNSTATTLEEVEALRIVLLGRKGKVTEVMEQFSALPGEEKRLFGREINSLKGAAAERIAALKEAVEASMVSSSGGGDSSIDATLPAAIDGIGSRHPISLVRAQILDVFHRIGFVTADGPEIEDDWHVFGALNFPENHPARDMQDTFFVEEDILLRTHTSSIQVRVMETQRPPLRVICPGRVFRNEAISYRAHCIFHQIEGLYIDKNVSFADLKQTIEYFAKECFGEKSEIRMRPSYFPFTEPSAEVDVSCNLCGGKGCAVCKGTGWLEIMGAGMVDPAVLESCGIDSKEYSGFAFGMGVERIAMLKYGVKDLRMYFEGDLRFMEQFKPIFL
ncbi:MAG: phenylalanine--tRNA ligase subunit alpha [Rikenellaceae bacterium]